MMRILIRHGLGVAGAVLAAATAFAQPSKPAFGFSPEPGVTVQVTRVDAGHLALRFLPDGKAQLIEAPDRSDRAGGESFKADDYDFDGYKDLAVVDAVGMVNQDTAIWLYRKDSHRFEPLQAVQSKALTCGAMATVTLQSRARVLLSACRDGPAWFTDAYRYAADHRLYLYGAMRILDDTIAQKVCGAKADAGMPTVFRLRLDEGGRSVAQACEPYGDWHDISADSHVKFTVPVARLPLHEAPDGKPARRYLVRGDSVDVLDVRGSSDAWLQVRFQNPKHGAIIGWVSAQEAHLAD